ncbi:MAG: IS256 family transposase [Spartobacteria bacterium]|nr:IS256 family transposase [Spartobacteria bacterium]
MTQMNITLDTDFFIDLFKLDKNEAFARLMETILNQFLQAESTEALRVNRYERTSERTDSRNGIRARSINTRIGKLRLLVPRHRNHVFHSTLLENYQRSELALYTTMMEMVIQGVSTRKIKKITEEMCGTSFSKSTISNLCKNLDEAVQAFKNRLLDKPYPFVMADAMYIKVREDSAVRSKALLVALGIDTDGRKEILGFEVCEGESEHHWEGFFTSLKQRGLTGVDLITSDQHAGLVAAIRKVFQGSAWQRCQVHFARNIVNDAPKSCQKELKVLLREMFNQETVEKAREKRKEILEMYQKKAAKSMATLDEGFEDAMNVMCLPPKYRKILRTSNLLERENQELRRREKTIRIFPNVASAVRLLGAVLQDHHDSWSMKSRVFNTEEYLQHREDYVRTLRIA